MSIRKSLALGVVASLVPTVSSAAATLPADSSPVAPTAPQQDSSSLVDAYPSAPMSAQESEAVTTAGPGEAGDVGPSFIPPPPDDAPVPGIAMQATPGIEAFAAAGECGSKYQPRGGSLIPPSGGWLVYWDVPGSGYEVRGMRGIECLGDDRNFYVDYVDAQRYTASNATYGRRVVTKGGYVYEGCLKQDSNDRFWCDFSSNRSKPSRLTPSTTSQYFWRVLRDWASYQATTTAACAGDIVGLWVGASELHDVAVDCFEAGPYTPQ